MDGAALIQRVREAGAEIALASDKINVRYASRLPEELCQQLQKNREDVVRYLLREPTSADLIRQTTQSGVFENGLRLEERENAALVPPSAKERTLVDFYQLVRSAGIDHGVRLDAGDVDRWLPGSDRALVCTGSQLGRKKRSAMARHLALRMVTARGIVPDGWTVSCLCNKCGPVWAAKGSDTHVSTCIWCDLRKARKWFPRPRMQCGKCSMFTTDNVNPAGGLGSCGAGQDSGWLCFPHSRRPCADWREAGGAA